MVCCRAMRQIVADRDIAGIMTGRDSCGQQVPKPAPANDWKAPARVAEQLSFEAPPNAAWFAGRRGGLVQSKVTIGVRHGEHGWCLVFQPKGKQMRTRVVEFKTQVAYEQWLNERGDEVRIINVSTTPRWSLWDGFMGGAKTYTVTFEELNEDNR
jgi:hypothetical protein